MAFGRKKMGRRGVGLAPFKAGLIALVVVGLATFFGFTKLNPFAHPYEVTAVFKQASNIKPRSPVRIAGVAVGEVTEVEPVEGGGAKLKMKINDVGLPLHKDATMKIRPRIFLEGNFFVDVQPGSPSVATLDDGSTVPATQTASPVQFADVLSALQTDTREDLKVLLKEYSHAIDGPGGDSFNKSIRYWEPAYKNVSIANEATLGTEPGDLQRLLRGQQGVAAALIRDEGALKGLVTNLNITAGAFASEDVALAQSIPLLDETLDKGMPALAALNSSLPSLRAFAKDALPGTKSTGPMIDASLPFIKQARRLMSRKELRGLVADLRPTVPQLVQLQEGQVGFLGQNRALSSCQNNVILPFAKDPVPDPDFPGNSAPFYKAAARGLPGLAGESRITDANSPQVRAQFGGNASTFVSTGDNGERFLGFSATPLIGTRPARPNQKPKFRPDIPCETQEPPDLHAPGGTSQAPRSVRVKSNTRDKKILALQDKTQDLRVDLGQHLQSLKKGQPSIDPTQFNPRAQKVQAKRLGLKRKKGKAYKFERIRKKGHKK